MDDLEIEPLRVALSVHIVLEPQVVLYVVDFDCPPQVRAFEFRVEDQHVVLLGHADCVQACPVPLRCEFRQVLEQKFVQIALKVTLSRFLVEKAVGAGDFSVREKSLKVYRLGRVLFEVAKQVLVTYGPRERVVNYHTPKLLSVQLLRVQLKKQLPVGRLPL